MTSIRLAADDRNTLLEYYRRDPDPQVRLRAHLLLLLAGGYAWAVVAAVLFTSPDTIARWKRRFEHGGVAAVLGRPRGRRRSAAWAWAAAAVAWVLTRRPADFGFARSRWSCAAVAVVLREDHGTPSAARRSATGCGKPAWSGAGPGRPCGPKTPTARPSSAPCGGCWPACPTTRRPCSPTRWTST
jgi:hypothetical protein